jgi:cytochrome b pre-mRNA-processing protein 3
MLGFVKTIRKRQETAEKLYQAALAQARHPYFYADHGVPDTVTGRFEMTVLHAFLVWNRLRAEGPKGRKLAQALFDVMFIDMERALRLIGVGDLSVPHHMKRMMRGFKGRALAYRDGLENPDDPEVLLSALSRNLFGTIEEITDDAPLHWFAEYIRGKAGFLARQSWSAIAQGIVLFEGAVNEQENTENSAGPRMAA